MAMSWPWTRMSVSVSSGVTKALCRREPIMALIRAMTSWLDSTCAWSTAESWIVALRVTLRSIRGWWAMKPPTSRTRLLLQGQVGGDVPHRPALAQRRVVPLLRGEPLEQVGGAGSLVVDRSPHGIGEGRSHRGHLNLLQVKTGGRTRVRLISKNCG